MAKPLTCEFHTSGHVRYRLYYKLHQRISGAIGIKNKWYSHPLIILVSRQNYWYDFLLAQHAAKYPAGIQLRNHSHHGGTVTDGNQQNN